MENTYIMYYTHMGYDGDKYYFHFKILLKRVKLGHLFRHQL